MRLQMAAGLAVENGSSLPMLPTRVDILPDGCVQRLAERKCARDAVAPRTTAHSAPATGPECETAQPITLVSHNFTDASGMSICQA